MFQNLIAEIQESLQQVGGIILAALGVISMTLPEINAAGSVSLGLIGDFLQSFRGLFEELVTKLAVVWVFLPSRVRQFIETFTTKRGK
jgi:hypothetical protein